MLMPASSHIVGNSELPVSEGRLLPLRPPWFHPLLDPPPQIGICYLPPARNTQCGAAPISNTSRLVLGAGPVPLAVGPGGLASMQSAPLSSSGPSNTTTGSTKPSFTEFRRVLLAPSVRLEKTIALQLCCV